jgi:CPA1 family monovalent cation:H+ antiporter
LVTLIGGGLTLPVLVSRLNVPPGDDEEGEEVRKALAAMSRAAHERLDALRREGRIDAEDAKVLAHRFASQRRLPGAPVDASERRRFAAQAEVLDAERQALRELRGSGEMDNIVLRRIVHALDVAEEAILLADGIETDERTA